MFVPIEQLPPILGDLIADGHVAGPARPWLGVAADEVRGRLMVSRVTPGGPGEKAGIRRGDEIVGVAGAAPRGLADFYRKVWATGDGRRDRAARCRAAAARSGASTCKSMNRLDHLKLKSTL